MAGEALSFAMGGRVLLTARDGEYESGGAGFLVEEGGFLARGFRVERAARDGSEGL